VAHAGHVSAAARMPAARVPSCAASSLLGAFTYLSPRRSVQHRLDYVGVLLSCLGHQRRCSRGAAAALRHVALRLGRARRRRAADDWLRPAHGRGACAAVRCPRVAPRRVLQRPGANLGTACRCRVLSCYSSGASLTRVLPLPGAARATPRAASQGGGVCCSAPRCWLFLPCGRPRARRARHRERYGAVRPGRAYVHAGACVCAAPARPRWRLHTCCRCRVPSRAAPPRRRHTSGSPSGAALLPALTLLTCGAAFPFAGRLLLLSVFQGVAEGRRLLFRRTARAVSLTSACRASCYDYTQRSSLCSARRVVDDGGSTRTCMPDVSSAVPESHLSRTVRNNAQQENKRARREPCAWYALASQRSPSLCRSNPQVGRLCFPSRDAARACAARATCGHQTDFVRAVCREARRCVHWSPLR